MAELLVRKQFSDLNFLFKANPNVSSSSDVSVVTELDAIRQSVLNILSTNYGERLFNPEFGANLRQFLFEDLSYPTLAAIASQISIAISNDEPRVIVLNVNINSSASNPHIVNIVITIQVVATEDVADIETTLERIR